MPQGVKIVFTPIVDHFPDSDIPQMRGAPQVLLCLGEVPEPLKVSAIPLGPVDLSVASEIFYLSRVEDNPLPDLKIVDSVRQWASGLSTSGSGFAELLGIPFYINTIEVVKCLGCAYKNTLRTPNMVAEFAEAVTLPLHIINHAGFSFREFKAYDMPDTMKGLESLVLLTSGSLELSAWQEV